MQRSSRRDGGVAQDTDVPDRDLNDVAVAKETVAERACTLGTSVQITSPTMSVNWYGIERMLTAM